jgi:hypothetical protein
VTSPPLPGCSCCRKILLLSTPEGHGRSNPQAGDIQLTVFHIVKRMAWRHYSIVTKNVQYAYFSTSTDMLIDKSAGTGKGDGPAIGPFLSRKNADLARNGFCFPIKEAAKASTTNRPPNGHPYVSPEARISRTRDHIVHEYPAIHSSQPLISAAPGIPMYSKRIVCTDAKHLAQVMPSNPSYFIIIIYAFTASGLRRLLSALLVACLGRLLPRLLGILVVSTIGAVPQYDTLQSPFDAFDGCHVVTV